jgi:hypothetical protein
MVKNKYIARKYQAWIIVTLLFMLFFRMTPPQDLSSIAVGMWTMYFAFTCGVLGVDTVQKGVALHHQRSSGE